METELIIFDLDGTLVDSRRDIAAAVNELRAALGKPALPEADIFGFIGHGVRALLSRSLHESSPSKLDSAVERYLSIYRRHLLDTTRPFPGVGEALDALVQVATLAVLTNKPRRESEAILEGLGLSRFFGFVYGGEDFSERKPHPMGVNALLERAAARRDRTLFVGDSKVDCETARNAGIRMCLVDYGLEPPESCEGLSRDIVVGDLRELIPWVQK